MKLAIAVISGTAVIFSISGATVQSTSANPAATSKTAGNSTSTAKGHSAVSHSTHARNGHSKGRGAHRAPAPSYQLQPTPERYQEIQKALADRGYFKGEVNGQWGPDSVDALQRFQADQQIPNDGKINSLSLIGLGLGPKHDVGAVPHSASATPSGSEPQGPPVPAETPDKPPTTIVPIPPK